MMNMPIHAAFCSQTAQLQDIPERTAIVLLAHMGPSPTISPLLQCCGCILSVEPLVFPYQEGP